MSAEVVLCGAVGVAAVALNDTLHDLAGPFGDMATIATGSAIVLVILRRTVKAWRGIDRLLDAIVGDKAAGKKGIVDEFAEHRAETEKRLAALEAKVSRLTDGDDGPRRLRGL